MGEARLIRLNARNRRVNRYVPPFEVQPFYEDIDTTASPSEQVSCLLWIPAALVARFRFQFPHLIPESDELFSIGVAKVVEIVNRKEFSGDKIGAVCNMQCRRAMEDHANGLHSVVKVCTTTRYENRKRGVVTPGCRSLPSDGLPTLSAEDDTTELLVQDAAEILGIDISSLTLVQKKRLSEVLS